MAAEVFRVRAVAIDHDAAPAILPDGLAATVAAHWERRAAENPRLFDGDILLFRDVAVAEGVLRATAVTVKYAVLAALLDLRPPGLALVNLFGAAAPLASDGALLLGRMGPHTFEPGAVKFASGTPDLSDLDRPGGTVDLDGSILREFAEETGLDPAAAEPASGYVVAREGPYLAIVRALRFPQTAAVLKERAEAAIAREDDPELAGTAIVRGPDDAVLADAAPLVRPLVRALLGGGSDAPAP